MVKLNIGSGPLRLEGEIGVDLYPTAGCDVQADLLALPFLDGSADAIRLDHVLEHLDQRAGLAALTEARRVLVPGGRVRVGVPDIAQYCAAWSAAAGDLQAKAHLLRGIYGGQMHAGEHHASGYDPESLVDLLAAAGFLDVTVASDDGEWRLEGYCIKAEGVRP